MSEFCKSVKLGRFKKKKLRGYVQLLTLFNQCWFTRKLVIVARCPRERSEHFITSSNEFYAFPTSVDLQSSAFFQKTYCGAIF